MQLSSLQTQSVTIDQTQFGYLENVVPDSMKFAPIQRGMSARRTPIKVRPDSGQTWTSNGNKIIRFNLPNDALYDTRYGWLSFTVALAVTGGTYSRFHSGIFSIIRRLRVMAGATELEDLDYYNRLQAFLWEILNPPDVTSAIGVTTMGFGTQAQRNGLSPQSDYACPLFSGVLNTELLPLDNIKGYVWVEITLEDGVNCVETDGTNPVITVSNPIFHVERLDIDPAYRARLSSMVASQGLRIGFRTWNRFVTALTTGSMQQITLNTKNSSINSILNFLINSSTISDTTVNDKFLTWLPTPVGGVGTFQRTQLQINGKQFPEEPIECLSTQRYEAFQMLCRWCMKWKLNGILDIAPPISNAAFQVNRFVQIDDLEAYPEYPQLVNPASTVNISNSLLKTFNFTNTIGANYQIDQWVESFREVRISQQGQAIVYQ